MKRLLIAIAALFLAGQAQAADNYAATEGSGKTFRCLELTLICFPYFIPSDNAGHNIAGAFGAAMPLGGIALGLYDGTNLQQWVTASSMAKTGVNGNNMGTVALWAYNGTTFDAATINAAHQLLVSGPVYGPTANGSAAANPPVLMGGTATGGAAGNVSNWKVDSSGLGYNSIASWAGGALGAMANYGTSPGAVLVPGVNAFVTNTNANGQAVMANSSPVVVASDQSAIPVNSQPATTGGLINYLVQPGATDNHAVIKAGAGQVYKISVTNNSATVNYLRLYNATTGFNGCNSATNIMYETAIPASTSVAGIVDTWNSGLAFSTGISICVTSGYAQTDTTAATASAMNVNIGYK